MTWAFVIGETWPGAFASARREPLLPVPLDTVDWYLNATDAQAVIGTAAGDRAEVVLKERIAVGDPECRVVVRLTPAEGMPAFAQLRLTATPPGLRGS